MKDVMATMAKPTLPNDDEKPDDLVQQVLDHRAMRAHNTNQRSVELPQRWHTIRLDADVADFYQATGEGWQLRINEALRTLAGI
ncbi:BrnA antitoxin family protein [Rhizobium sp. PL01]|uniref:BrnA antitoxin family protein n=1 Tax=Rhizobium sp. PL01 TaxID=3085631 RepID=UPI00298202B3|nr:BrnA antitoxin family protein [Rhizobium sp. PL01]MDW5317174.1 BrnA antitoxin family protein [Rhizobium sp. PL01]